MSTNKVKYIRGEKKKKLTFATRGRMNISIIQLCLWIGWWMISICNATKLELCMTMGDAKAAGDEGVNGDTFGSVVLNRGILSVRTFPLPMKVGEETCVSWSDHDSSDVFLELRKNTLREILSRVELTTASFDGKCVKTVSAKLQMGNIQTDFVKWEFAELGKCVPTCKGQIAENDDNGKCWYLDSSMDTRPNQGQLCFATTMEFGVDPTRQDNIGSDTCDFFGSTVFQLSNKIENRTVITPPTTSPTVSEATNLPPALATFMVIMVLTLLGCIGCFMCLRRRNMRRNLATAARKAEIQTRVAPPKVKMKSIEEEETRKKVEEVMMAASELHRLVNSWPSDMTSLAMRQELVRVLWKYELASLGLTSYFFTDESNDRVGKALMVATTLRPCSVVLGFMCDLRNGSDGLTEQIQETESKLFEACAHLPTPGTMMISWEELFSRDANDEEWGLESRNLKSLRRRMVAFKPTFMALGDEDDEIYNGEVMNRQTCCIQIERVRRYKIFYGSFWLLLFIIFFTWVARINSNTEREMQGPPGGFGKTFLPVPPQYNFRASSRQRVGVPIVFGFMHCALACLGLLPLTMTKGIWRDISCRFPGFIKYIPVNDFESIHRYLGSLTMLFIFFGATTWMITMGMDCANGIENSCLAFEPNVRHFFDPIENVLMLRFVIWLLWFPILPLMFWAKASPPSWTAPDGMIRSYWYELCLYSHILVAVSTLVLALVARFEVFFPILPSWSLYFLDTLRESFLRRKRVDIIEREVFSRAQDGIPTAVRLRLRSGGFSVKAGQWIYLQVPEIDYTWHPFSVANGSSDEFVDLHIGIQSSSSKHWYRSNRKDYFRWKMRCPTWTFKLYERISRTKPRISCFVRGAYGSKFDACFDPSFGGSILIGSGTGLTAALSLLHEIVSLRKQGFDTPKKVWFVWSCRKVDDLLWIWNRLLDLILDATEAELFDLEFPDENSSMFDWLGVSIFVTRSSISMIQQFDHLHQQSLTQSSSKVEPTLSVTTADLTIQDIQSTKRSKSVTSRAKAKIHKWLVSRVVTGTLDGKGTHIVELLHGVQSVLQTTDEHDDDIALAFCGPSSMAATIQQAIRQVDSMISVEFSADHQ